MLLLYVDDLFLTEKSNSLILQEEYLLSSSDKGLGDDALLSKHGGVSYCGWNILRIRDDGLQGHDHTYGIELEAIECCFIRVS